MYVFAKTAVMANTASSAVYNINYHLVWCPKYRKKILIGDLKEFLDQEITIIAESKNWEILEMRVMPDHIHLFVSCDPLISPTKIVKTFKGITANKAFKMFPRLGQIMWKGKLWSPSYYVGTAGHVSAQTIERYIREQEK